MTTKSTAETAKTTLQVLLVDDSDLQIEYQQSLLEGQDMNFLVANDGATALEICRSEKPDVVLLDIEMPGMSGLEVATELRADPNTAGIPIIMVSAKTSGEMIETAFMDGCSEYVTKPMHKMDILAKIQSLTGVPLLEQSHGRPKT